MDTNITDWCQPMQDLYTAQSQTRQSSPMLPRDIPDTPWQDLVTDFFTFNQLKSTFIITDKFSKYPFIYQTSCIIADSIIWKLQHLISQIWTSEKIIQPDNGPPFSSRSPSKIPINPTASLTTLLHVTTSTPSLNGGSSRDSSKQYMQPYPQLRASGTCTWQPST